VSATATARRPWVAALLELLIPGLGHLYAGFVRRAVLLFLLYWIVAVAALVVAVAVPIPVLNLALAAAIVLACRLLVAAVAFFSTRRSRREAAIGRLSRWYSLVAAALVMAVVVDPLWLHVMRTSFVRAFRIPNGAMEWSLLRGDHLLAAKWAYGWRLPLLEKYPIGARPPRRGDLIVFRFPEDPRRVFLKRVVGLPGEELEIRNKVVYVDGKVLEEPYVHFLDETAVPFRDDWGPREVPADSYFVLGDNRDNSRDSRFWGYVEEELLLGQARVVYWSVDPVDGRIRWERIGQRLE